LLLFFVCRPKGGSAEERKEGGEGGAAAFRPDVAYNLLHTLFYGLLAFSTMRSAHVIAESERIPQQQRGIQNAL